MQNYFLSPKGDIPMSHKNRRLTFIVMIVMALVLMSTTLVAGQDAATVPLAGNEQVVPAGLDQLSLEEQDQIVDSPEHEVIEEIVPAAVEAWNATRWYVQDRLGIGTETPSNKLDVYTPGATGSHIVVGDHWLSLQGLNDPVAYKPRLPYIEWREANNGPRAMYMGWGNTSKTSEPYKHIDMVLENEYALSIMNYSPHVGIVGIGTKYPQSTLHVKGTTTTQILKITGGGDLAEPFDVAGAATVEPGMVVAIDPAHPGQLRLADHAYDRTVAGVVSGAGGIQPGLILQQEGTLVAGEHPVALTGRVYVWADASHGAITPGDLLTTSDTPGHAMKVNDHALAQGAILGKAMTELKEGTGLVLILISLQ
jgi:hypothetical protein